MSQDIQNSIDKLSKKDWQEIQAIYDEIVNHKGSFYEEKSGENLKDSVISLPYHDYAPIVFRTMKFLYDKKLIVVFDWGNWDEGREIFKRTGEHKFDDVSSIDTFKSLTAVARNDRFNEGAFARLFETGDARLLFKRILTFNPKNNYND